MAYTEQQGYYSVGNLGAYNTQEGYYTVGDLGEGEESFWGKYKWYIIAAAAVGGGVWYWRKRKAAPEASW